MKFTETQELIAEFFGIILILFGDGVAAMVVLFGKNIPWPGGRLRLPSSMVLTSSRASRSCANGSGLSALPTVSPADTSGM
jgi:glycerol uptake facilitator-like aquaporin